MFIIIILDYIHNLISLNHYLLLNISIYYCIPSRLQKSYQKGFHWPLNAVCLIRVKIPILQLTVMAKLKWTPIFLLYNINKYHFTLLSLTMKWMNLLIKISQITSIRNCLQFDTTTVFGQKAKNFRKF